jgi:hypothetical protein
VTNNFGASNDGRQGDNDQSKEEKILRRVYILIGVRLNTIAQLFKSSKQLAHTQKVLMKFFSES